MEESNVKKNIAYNFIYQILVVILPLITTPYISRVLGPSQLGKYSYAYSIAYYFVMIVVLGLNNYGNRSIAMVRDDKDKLSKEFISIYLMQLISGIISMILYITYIKTLSNDVMSWIMFLYVMSAVLDINWFFFGMELFKLTVTRNIIIKLVTTIMVFIFVKSKSDIYLYSMIMVGGIFISQAVLWRFIKKYITFQKVTWRNVVKHIKPNLILFIPIVAVSLYKVMDKIMLGTLTNKTEVGLYEASERIIQIPMALIQSLGTVMLPKMTNLISKNKTGMFQKYFEKSIVFAMFLSSSTCFGMMGVARYFVPIYYGGGYEKCVYLFQLLLPSCIFLAFANVIRTQYLIPNKKDKIFINSVILGAIVNLIINFIMIPYYKSIGAALGTLIAESTVCFYQSYKIRKEIDIKKYLKISSPFVISGAIMYLIISNINFSVGPFINLLLLIIVGIMVYFTCFAVVAFDKIIKLVKGDLK